MLARDYCEASKRNNRPIILSHRMCLNLLDVVRFMFSYGSSSVCELFSPLMSIADMLPGIKEGQQKMSKSDPSSAIFMEDSEVISLDKCAFLNINNQFFFNNLNNSTSSISHETLFLYRNIYQSMFHALFLAMVCSWSSCLLQSQVNEKIGQAFCPHKVTEGNPCLEYIEYIVLPKSGRFSVLCKETDGSNR